MVYLQHYHIECVLLRPLNVKIRKVCEKTVQLINKCARFDFLPVIQCLIYAYPAYLRKLVLVLSIFDTKMLLIDPNM